MQTFAKRDAYGQKRKKKDLFPEFSELTAPQLREELHARDQDTSGKKAQLMVRLAQTLEAEIKHKE
eukprot:COSAG06_NODE_59639_length_273_cov_1.155172_1_plen_65_part_10